MWDLESGTWTQLAAGLQHSFNSTRLEKYFCPQYATRLLTCNLPLQTKAGLQIAYERVSFGLFRQP